MIQVQCVIHLVCGLVDKVTSLHQIERNIQNFRMKETKCERYMCSDPLIPNIVTKSAGLQIV